MKKNFEKKELERLEIKIQFELDMIIFKNILIIIYNQWLHLF